MAIVSRSRVLSVAIAAVLLLATGCSGDSNSNGTGVSGIVKIGLLAPLGGANAEAGRDAQRGADLAASVVNAGADADLASTGIWGAGRAALLSIVTMDTESDRQRAVDATDRLVAEERVAGMVGAFDAEATLDASQRAERLGTPFVSGDVPLSALTERGLSWFFRSGPDVRSFGGAFLSLLRGAERDGVARRRVAVLYGDRPEGHDLQAMLQELAEETDVQLVAQERYALGDGDLTDEVGRIRAAAPDMVLFGALPGAGRVLGDALGGLGYAPPGIVVYGAAAEAVPLASMPGLDGRVSRQVGWSSLVAQANPLATQVSKRYQSAYGGPMTEAAAAAYTAVMVLARAIGAAGGLEPERIRSALVATNVPGAETVMPWEGVRFDVTHQNTLAATVVEQATGSRFAVVYPRELATAAFAWPATDPGGRPAGAGATTGSSGGAGTGSGRADARSEG
ncbi:MULTISPECIES: ABC transporter substrate-binding protein [unclassified Parafrankia]|uniref:ABC transporter substrate-binding protein n=1 Tax=unclassified Parafrankia TaxID=2994368 RepID=UPI000DA552E0|nr:MULTISPECIES: ABC transporter substrate-binding protein [unclassified Parafrankia]TCJ36717.1 ABC transporter substrate-binding protein [Parafrankia sp. BMG5.11]SQD97423.1 Extracellular ligand-binding receptor [Parafrankia sp. Ea1.12]